MSDGDWRTEFKRLWKELVPPEGQADTVQGELIRALGRLEPKWTKTAESATPIGPVSRFQASLALSEM
jgi:hypothetical protein